MIFEKFFIRFEEFFRKKGTQTRPTKNVDKKRLFG